MSEHETVPEKLRQPRKRSRARAKLFGLKFYWTGRGGKELAQVSWYETEEEREMWLRQCSRQKSAGGKPRFTRIDKVEQ